MICWERRQLSLSTTTDQNGFLWPWVGWNVGGFCRKTWQLSVIHGCVLLSITIPREKEVSHGVFWEEKSTLMFWMVRQKSSSWNGPWLMKWIITLDWCGAIALRDILGWEINIDVFFGKGQHKLWFLKQPLTDELDYHVKLDQNLVRLARVLGDGLWDIYMKPDW